MTKKILLTILIFGILFVSGCSSINELNCDGEYIEYQGNCCLDRDYNNVCDVIDIEKEGEINNDGTRYTRCTLDSDCRAGFCGTDFECHVSKTKSKGPEY